MKLLKASHLLTHQAILIVVVVAAVKLACMVSACRDQACCIKLQKRGSILQL